MEERSGADEIHKTRALRQVITQESRRPHSTYRALALAGGVAHSVGEHAEGEAGEQPAEAVLAPAAPEQQDDEHAHADQGEVTCFSKIRKRQ